jgi:hypothetical protein
MSGSTARNLSDSRPVTLAPALLPQQTTVSHMQSCMPAIRPMAVGMARAGGSRRSGRRRRGTMIPVEILNADGTPIRRRRLRKRRSLWALGMALLAPVSVAIAIPLAVTLILEDSSSTIGSMDDGLPPFAKSSKSGTIAARAAGSTSGTIAARAAGSTRSVYPYSIVLGGAHRADDAREADGASEATPTGSSALPW